MERKGEGQAGRGKKKGNTKKSLARVIRLVVVKHPKNKIIIKKKIQEVEK